MKETEVTTNGILDRMDKTMTDLEQMSFDVINITDRMVTLLNDAREMVAIMKVGNDEECREALAGVSEILERLLETAFNVNNLSHELETVTVYQRDTVDDIEQVIDFLYCMNDDMEM